MPEETRFGLTFSRDVSPDTQGEIAYEVDTETVIREVSVRFYGSATLLEVRPFVRTRHGNTVDLVETVGQSKLDGDDDKFEWKTDEEISEGDEIVIEYDNQDIDYEHQFRVNMNIEESESGVWV